MTGGAEMQQRKAQIRRKARRARQRLPNGLRRWKDTRIAQRVLACEALKRASTVCLYWSLAEEVSTADLILQFLDRGQRVALPCHSTETALRLVRDTQRDLAPAGSTGILEPTRDCPQVDPESIEYYLLPGIAFDIYGHRIGFGGGYFDRILARRRAEVPAAALAYECQMFREVPFNPAHDVPVEQVFTEETIYAYHRSETVAADPHATAALARSLASPVPGRFHLGLVGPLGVGKTTFIRGFLEELEVLEQVTSPSFVLMKEYQGRLPVRHIDLYRLGDRRPSEEDLQMFLETLSEFPGPVLVEWADFAQDWLPLSVPWVHIAFLSEDKRQVALETYCFEDRQLHEFMP